jgi:hypothetical protein
MAAGTQLSSAAAPGTNSSSCELLASSAAAVQTALALPDGADWPDVLTPSSFTAAGSVQLHSVAWLCFKGAAQWDAYGAASSKLAMQVRHAAVVQQKLLACCNSARCNAVRYAAVHAVCIVVQQQ